MTELARLPLKGVSFTDDFSPTIRKQCCYTRILQSVLQIYISFVLHYRKEKDTELT